MLALNAAIKAIVNSNIEISIMLAAGPTLINTRGFSIITLCAEIGFASVPHAAAQSCELPHIG
jgi:hypothetical protein